MADSGPAELITAVKESLEREIRNARFDAGGIRLDCHAVLWQTGSRWNSRRDVWAEKIDSPLETKGREIAELRERIAKLEKQRGQ